MKRKREFDQMLHRAQREWNTPSRDQRTERTLRHIEANTLRIAAAVETIRDVLVREADEPVAEVIAAYEAGEQGVTVKPSTRQDTDNGG